MMSYLRGTAKVTLLPFRWPICPSFSLQKQRENTLLEPIRHKSHLQRELIVYHIYLIHSEVGSNNAFQGMGLKVAMTVRNFYDRVGRNLLMLFTLLLSSLLVKVFFFFFFVRSRKKSFLLKTMEHNSMVPLMSPAKCQGSVSSSA